MAHVLKDNASTATPVPILPTGEQQIAVSIPIDSRIKPLISFFCYQGRLSYSTDDR